MKTALQYRYRALCWYAALSLCLGGGALAQDAPSMPEGDQCVACHLDLEELPEDFQTYDVHLKQGLSCVGCHGGDATTDDMDEAKAPGTGFVGVPARTDTPQLCGACHSNPSFMHDFQPRIHTDQVEQYFISVHGQKLKEGDLKVAECTGCHTAHGILPAADARSTVYPLNVPAMCQTCHGDAAYMADYGIRTNQFSAFAESVHGKALLEEHDVGAPACNDCHGNHGALPPGVASLNQVCGTCHVNNAQYFAESAMAEPFEDIELHACIECHGAHDVRKTFDAMTGVGEGSVCLDCHDEGEDAYEAAQGIYAHLAGLVAAYDSAAAQQREVVRVGMDDMDIAYLLKDAHQSLIQARTLVHTFDPEKVGARTDEGVAKAREALALSLAQIKEFGTRRIGFGLATLFITLLAIGLYLKIREIDKR